MRANLLTLWEVSRPAFAAGVPLITLLGVTVGARASGMSAIDLPVIAFVQLILLSLPLNVIVYGVNDVYDYASDQQNGQRSAGWGTALPPEKHAFVLRAAAIAAALLVLSALLSGSLVNLLLVVSMVVLAYLYSVPPVRLKVRPPLDSLVNGIGYFLLPFSLGFTYFQPIENVPDFVLLIALSVAGFHAFATLRDRSADVAAEDTTIGIRFGHRPTTLIAAAAQLPALAYWFEQSDYWQPTLFFVSTFIIMFTSVFFSSERYVKIGIKVVFILLVILGLSVLFTYM